MEESFRDKGQASLEYLLVIGLTLAIIVPATFLFFNYSKESTEEITDAIITKVGRNIIDSAENIYYSGVGSKTVLELTIPEKVKSAIIIDGRELVFNITSSFGETEMVFFSSVNLTTTIANCIKNVCSLPELSSQGLKKIKLEATSSETVHILPDTG